MVSCTNCGAENPDDAVYCRSCGARLGRRRPLTRHRGEVDYLGALSAGVILIILAVAYIRYPFEIPMVVSYFENMISGQRFIKPPLALLTPAIFFFNVVGVWSLALSGLRVILQRSVRRAIGDFTGALFSFFLAFLLTNYANDVLSERVVLAYLVVGIGLLVIVNAIVAFAYPER